MDIELTTVEDLYQHYKDVRKRIEEAARQAAVKNDVNSLAVPPKNISDSPWAARTG